MNTKRQEARYRRELRAEESYKVATTINVIVEKTCQSCFFYIENRSFGNPRADWWSADWDSPTTHNSKGEVVEKKKRVRRQAATGCTNPKRRTTQLPLLGTCGFHEEKEED